MITRQKRDEIMQRESALREWLRVHRRNSYTPEEVAHMHPPTNEERSAVEIFDWHETPPDRYFAYMAQDYSVTTWMGERLASTWQLGSVWRSNMGDRRRNFRCRGTNGVEYAGVAYIDAGTYVRLRKVKGGAR